MMLSRDQMEAWHIVNENMTHRTEVINLDSDTEDSVEFNDIRILDVDQPGLSFEINRTPKTLERPRFFRGASEDSNLYRVMK